MPTAAQAQRGPESAVKRQRTSRTITLAQLKDPLGVQPTALKLYRAIERGMNSVRRFMLDAARDEAIAVSAARKAERGELAGAPREAANKSVLFYDRLVEELVMEAASGDEGYVARNMDAAYRLGQRAAFDRATTPRKVQREIRRLPSHRSAVRAASRQTLDLVGGLTDATRGKIAEAITEGLNGRESPKEIADRIAREFDLSESRAAAIAQTESVRAHAQGSLNTLRSLRFERVTADVEFATNVHGSAAPCPQCLELEGVVYTISEAEGIIPVHPRCQAVAPDSVIQSGSVHKGYRRKYSGDLFTLRTVDGDLATVTAKHPVLTDKGFVAADALDPQQHRLGRLVPGEAAAFDQQNEPTRADQVFKSLTLRRDLCLSQVPVASPDFHGDATDGDVDVVWTARDLLAYRYAALAQYVGKLLLGADMGLALLDQSCSPGEQLRRLALSSPRPLCRVERLAPALSQLTLVAQLLRLADGTESNTGAFQPLAHTPIAEAVALRKRRDRVAALVSRNLVRFSRFESSSRSHRGVVYDFQTANAMFAAGGVVVSNCGWIPVVD